MQYTLPKGVFDVLPEGKDWNRSDHWQYVEEIMRQTAHTYGFKEIRTPIFEKSELFIRAVGEVTDVVTKEMYTFLDKADRSLSLRPEGTAAVMRSFIENRLETINTFHKYFYIGPMFRYERPQAGRYRQFHHFGAEAIGNGSPEQDVEIIDMLWELYRRLGLQDLTILINSVGDASSRLAYKTALSKYLHVHFQELSPESQVRFSKNILRILDSKNDQDQKILEHAPSLRDYLNEECQTHFNRVLELLTKLKLPYIVNSKLVRGLDYYNKTVFEITANALGAQNAIVGGGRYDGLIADLGGPSLPSVGFATGIERVLQTMIHQKAAFPPAPHPFLFIISLGKESLDYCLTLLYQLRHLQIPSEMDFGSKKIQQSLQVANHLGATFCLIIGETELSLQKGNLKNMTSRENIEIPLSELTSYIMNLFFLSQKE